MKPIVVAVLLSACATSPELAELADPFALPEAPPPPPQLLPAPCAPGSAFELGGVPFADLQTAVDLAGPGDEVVICAGTVAVGDLNVVADDFILRGETGDPADVVLTAGTIRFAPGAAPQAALRGLTLGAHASLEVSTDARFTLGDVIIRDHDASEATVVSLYTSEADLYRVRVTNNQCDSALYIQRVSQTQARVRFADVLFDHNAVQTWLAGVWGGDMGHGTLTLQRVTFEDNEGPGGYPLFVDGDGYRAWFRDLTIRRNRLAGSAIEVYYEPGGSLVDGLTVTDNQMDAPVLLWNAPGSTSTIQHATFLRNTGPYLGAAWTDPSPLATYYMTAMRLRDVDFGAGADDNSPVDIEGCASPVGYVARGRINAAQPCP